MMKTAYDPERRTGNRHRCHAGARLFISGRPSIPCAVRDLTPDGARLDLSSQESLEIPEKLFVLLPGVGELWAARIRWRKDGEIGVEFVAGEADWTRPRYPDLFALRVQVAEMQSAANGNQRQKQ